MDNEVTSWREEDSAVYSSLAEIAVPARAEQIATLLTLVPFRRDAAFRTVEIGCGEGILARALLDAFPNASILALDGSSAMRDATSARLAEYGSRAAIDAFNLMDFAWHEALDNADLVLSSLVIHHLDDAGKAALFRTVHERTSGRAAFLIGDLVRAQRPEANRLFAGAWDHVIRLQSEDLFSSDAPFRLFQGEQWNIY